MRELKFRAWNKEEFIMVYKNEDDSSDYWDGVCCSGIQMVNARLMSGGYEWMQYTGMKDRNDKGIYEGDLILTKYNDKPFEVYWSDDYLAYYIRFANIHINKSGTTALSLFDRMKYEVIGNIYENTELIL